MKNKSRFRLVWVFALVATLGTSSSQMEDPPLHSFAEYPVGAALSRRDFWDDAAIKIAAHDFNSVTACNRMKMHKVALSEHSLNFVKVDSFIDWAEKHNKRVHGHALIWHQSTPRFCQGYKGQRCLGSLHEILHHGVRNPV